MLVEANAKSNDCCETKILEPLWPVDAILRNIKSWRKNSPQSCAVEYCSNNSSQRHYGSNKMILITVSAFRKREGTGGRPRYKRGRQFFLMDGSLYYRGADHLIRKSRRQCSRSNQHEGLHQHANDQIRFHGIHRRGGSFGWTEHRYLQYFFSLDTQLSISRNTFDFGCEKITEKVAHMILSITSSEIMAGTTVFDLPKSHSLLHRGQTDRVLSHRWIQSKWKTCPQFPKAMESPLSFVGEGFAWYSIEGSFNEFRQMAHCSQLK